VKRNFVGEFYRLLRIALMRHLCPYTRPIFQRTEQV